MSMDKIIKHKSAYIKSFEDAIVGNEFNTSYPSVNSSSPYHIDLNEEQEISTFAYSLGRTIKDNLKIGDNGDSGDGGISTSHNHDDRYALKNHNHDNVYAKIVHNHDDRYYTKAYIDNWIDRIINGDLLYNKINAKHIQAGTIVAGSSIIANGAIGSAHISSVSADKIDAGIIDTSKIIVQGANGNLKLKGNRLQVFEGIGNSQFERVSLGDVNNDGTSYGLRVRGRDGQTVLYDENGVYREGITDGSITNDKIGDDANIDGGKLNIHSVINNINDNNTGTIHGTKVDIDGESVSSKVYNIILNQNEHSETMERQQSEINQNREQINLKVSNQKYTEDMASMTSKLEKAESNIELLNDSIKLTASKTEVENQINNVKDFVSSEIGDISVGGANYLNNSAPRKATVDNLVTWDRTLNGTRRLTYWQDYNDSVETPQVGYHPHIDLETFHFPCIALINRNAKFSMANRELSLRHEIHKAEEVIVPNETYVISFDAYSDTSLFSFHGGLYHKNVESNNYNYHSGRMDITIEQEHVNTWQRYSFTFDTHKGINTSEPVYLVINGHNNPEGSGYIKNIKLERSNIVSQWTPSQFDIDDSLDDVVGSMKEYTNECIKTNNATLDVKFSGITQKVEETIKQTEVVENIANNAQSTANTANTNATNAQNTANTANQNATNAQNTANTANSNANKALTQITTINNKVASVETTLSGITSRVENVETITTTLDGKVTNQETRLAQAEQKITDKAITSVVKEAQFIKDMGGNISTNKSNISKIEQTATSITSRVDGLDGKYTQLKQTVDGIDVTGKVSFYDLRTEGATVINGSNITTGTINTNRVNIKGGTTKKIVIANDNYCVYDGSETDVNRKVFVGFRTNSATNVPSVMLGYNGINPTVDGAVVSGGTYTTYSHYPNNNNPEDINQSYGALAFKYGANYTQFSTLNMYQNGDIDLKAGAGIYFRPNLRAKDNHVFGIASTEVGCRAPFNCTSTIYANNNITTDKGLYGTYLSIQGNAVVSGDLNASKIATNRIDVYGYSNLDGNMYVSGTGTIVGALNVKNKAINGMGNIALARGTIYLPQGGGNNTTDYLRIGGGFMAGVSSGNFHFLTSGGSTSNLYARTLISSYSLEPTLLSETNNSAFDIINCANAINTKDGVKLVPTLSKASIEEDSNKTIFVNYNEETNQEEVSINYTSAISVLWKAVQELKQENEELKKLIKGVE